MNNNTMVQYQQQISEINRLKEQFQDLITKREKTYVQIGITLNALQEEFKEEGKFMQWLETETRISYSTANRYMKVASAFKGNESWAVKLGVKKAYLLTKIEDVEERLEFMKKHQVSKKSYDEIKTLLKEYLNKDKKETSTQKAINPKRAINKLKKTIDKELTILKSQKSKSELAAQRTELADLMDSNGYTIDELKELMSMPKPTVEVADEE